MFSSQCNHPEQENTNNEYTKRHKWCVAFWTPGESLQNRCLKDGVLEGTDTEITGS
jgi:hypothetical protein